MPGAQEMAPNAVKVYKYRTDLLYNVYLWGHWIINLNVLVLSPKKQYSLYCSVTERTYTNFESMVAHAKRPVETPFLRNLKPGSLIFILIVVLLNKVSCPFVET